MNWTPYLFVLIGLGFLVAAILFGAGYWFGYTGAQMRVMDAEKRMVRRFRGVVDREPEREAGKEYADFCVVDGEVKAC